MSEVRTWGIHDFEDFYRRVRRWARDAVTPDIPYRRLIRALMDGLLEREALQWLRRLNVVRDYFEYQCELDWWLYVELMFPPLFELVLGLLEFGFDDVLRGFIRPVGLRYRPKAGFLDRFLKPFEVFPEPGDWIGRHLPGARLVRGSRLMNGLGWLFKLDAWIQHKLFAWLVLDLLGDFFYNWAALLLRKKAFTCAAAQCVREWYGTGGLGEENWWPLFVDDSRDCFIDSTPTLRDLRPLGVEVRAEVPVPNQPGSIPATMIRVPGPAKVYVEQDLAGVIRAGRYRARLVWFNPAGGIAKATPFVVTRGGDKLVSVFSAPHPGPWYVSIHMVRINEGLFALGSIRIAVALLKGG